MINGTTYIIPISYYYNTSHYNHILKTTFQIESDLSVTLYINVDMHVSS